MRSIISRGSWLELRAIATRPMRCSSGFWLNSQFQGGVSRPGAQLTGVPAYLYSNISRNYGTGAVRRLGMPSLLGRDSRFRLAHAASYDESVTLTGSANAWSRVVENKRALIVSGERAESAAWTALLAAADWSVECVARRDQAVARIPEFLPSLLLLDLKEGELPAEVEESFAQRCRDSGLAVIVILRRPSPGDVAISFRRGAIDVLIPPFTAVELMAAVDRAGNFKDLYQENMDYRRQLEQANHELRESFNVLRMDQLAGRQVQLDILPREPIQCRGYRVAHSMVPSLYLSGDFVGYNAVFNRYVLFYFGDVSGHGASSAFVTVMLAFLLRQLRRRHVAEEDFAALARAPEGLAEHLNRQMLAMDLDKHLTFFSGAIDAAKGRFRYVVSALSPPPILVTQALAEFLPGRGKPLGLFKDAAWEIQERDFPPNSSLVVISDGLMERIEGATSVAREARLLELLTGVAPDHDCICNALGLKSIKEAPDDVSVLTVTHNA
jgi:sigma-B regulation protein RsbU (phosphoserine phosphatase)